MTKAMASGENPGHQSLTSEIIRKNRGTTNAHEILRLPGALCHSGRSVGALWQTGSCVGPTFALPIKAL